MPHSSAQLGDCMKFMKDIPDNFFELACVDPPIGKNRTQGVGKYGRQKQAGKLQNWDNKPPGPAYFKELFRVSRNQIIWCAVYYTHMLPMSRGWLIWDKGEGFYNRDFAEVEMAWTSFDMNAKKFRYDPLAGGDYRHKIHPTQKPVALYDWCFQQCAKPGDKILDTHLGSGSSRLSAWHLDLDFYGYESDPEHFLDQEGRFMRESAVQKIVPSKLIDLQPKQILLL